MQIHKEFTTKHITYKHKQYWQIGEKHSPFASQIPDAFLCKDLNAWLIPTTYISDKDLLSMFHSYVKQSFVKRYKSISRLQNTSKNTMKNLEQNTHSIKYKLALRLSIHVPFSIHSLCMIRLDELDWEKHQIIDADNGEVRQISNQLWNLLELYVNNTKPKKYLFEENDNIPLSEEKLYRSFLSFARLSNKKSA